MQNPKADPHICVASESDMAGAVERNPLDITIENACGSVKVKFGDVTHINFRLDRYLGFQTWMHSDSHFCIEIKLVGGKISAGYDDREKWQTIIAGLDLAVAQ